MTRHPFVAKVYRSIVIKRRVRVWCQSIAANVSRVGERVETEKIIAGTRCALAAARANVLTLKRELAQAEEMRAEELFANALYAWTTRRTAVESAGEVDLWEKTCDTRTDLLRAIVSRQRAQDDERKPPASDDAETRACALCGTQTRVGHSHICLPPA